MRRMVLLLSLALAGCDLTLETEAVATGPVTAPTGNATVTPMSPEEAARAFTEVVRAVEPVAVRECRRLAAVANCNFQIAVDPRPNAQPNAFQSVDKNGRPVVTFTATLIASAQNTDELAFVLGHEASHHIANHLERQRRNAESGAEIFAGLATLTGGGASDVATAQELGAVVGARSYSKEFELEADRLGTIITYRAGYNPLIGAEFFARIPDPGDRFLGSHPPNAARKEIVRRTSAELGLYPG